MSLIYDEEPNTSKTYICTRCHMLTANHEIISTKTKEPEFHWYCSNWKCYGTLDFEPHLRPKEPTDDC